MNEYDQYNDNTETVERDIKPVFRLDGKVPAHEIAACVMLLENFYNVILWDFERNQPV